ncbi:nitrogenase component 1 [Paenibacillus sp. S150]|uniref:nitrogenase component 1 n=1 Tax=Paenibacillus sp. S150 TaxID=2749826 RepID=UPI001C598763|nr:nitrogenase component 1 [Paenibacillus sp. S150]MBW4080715.1 oxalate:formate antiporter [Paenibacillus sp. S150]
MGAAIAINRNSCMLHGAVQTVKSITGAVPVIHSTSGCGVQQYVGVSSLSGNAGSGDTGGLGLPSTNFLERQVVFGGTSRLREQLKNTVKVKSGDFYVVLTGCTPELVGDDVPAMTKELQEQSYKAVHISTPGFKGSVHQGYTAAVLGILRQFDKLSAVLSERDTRRVNIFGVIPEQDVFWRGNLRGLQNGFAEIGAEANVLFGPGSSLDEWSRIFSASLNLSFSVHSLEICKWLEQQAGIPYLHFDGYPVGAWQTAQLLRSAAEKLELDGRKLEESIARNLNEERYYILQLLDAYYRYGFQKSFALIGDSSIVSGLLQFLVDPLGLIPRIIVLTDDLPRDTQASLSKSWTGLSAGSTLEIIFEQDGQKIEELVLRSGIGLLIGSSIEQSAAQRLNIPFLPVSFPVADRTVLNKGYAGFTGGLTLLEDLGSVIIGGTAL